MLNGREFKELSNDGFCGFVSVDALRLDFSPIPPVPGVYVVLSSSLTRPEFLPRSPAFWFKGRDPSAGLDRLLSRWDERSRKIYIGKANNLRERLGAYLRFGEGVCAPHWGGRFIWQLKNSGQLIICWKEVNDDSPSTVESAFIGQHFEEFGRLPFANLRRGVRNI